MLKDAMPRNTMLRMIDNLMAFTKRDVKEATKEGLLTPGIA